MATQITERLIDDLDPEMDADETISFSYRGTGYTIDLAEVHAKELDETLAPFIDVATKVSRSSAKTGKARNTAGPALGSAAGAIRAWAPTAGFEVNKRGRIPAHIAEAWENAGSPTL